MASRDGCVAVEVVAVVQRRRRRKTGFVRGVSGGGAEILGLDKVVVEVVVDVQRRRRREASFDGVLGDAAAE
ncbi:hypothetical protein LWI29_004879 [Acer saccharum]|uniref:Uncharacterized protein n=1 Tax=Acer saccharum TaxID=4024 RepID=A0AA39VUG7_ACESA|nr:hypothetical protein LWI29_004879 [Acer saccharum]